MKRILAVALLAIIAVSSLSFAVASANAMGMTNRGWGWNIGAWMKNGAMIPFQRSWVRLNGVVETLKIDNDPLQDVTGSLSINARTVSAEEDVIKKANATALWRTSEDKNIKEEGSWTYSFYAARLVNAKASTLGTEGTETDYQLDGTWNIVHVTITHTATKTGDEATGYTIDRQTRTTVEPIATGTGTLTVTGGWTDFVLSITGEKIYELSGKISRTRMTQMDFNKFKLSEDDTDVVSRVDLKVLAKNLRARPGWGSYDANMDFNCNYKIDIADLATVAANVQSS